MHTIFLLRRIILFKLLLFVFLNVDCQTTKSKTKEALNNYKYSVVIDMNHLSHKDTFNFKYIINRGFIFDENEYPIFLEKGKMYYVKYRYLSSENYMATDYLRQPTDTMVFSLSDSELDFIFRLTTDIFSFGGEIDYKGEKLPRDDYDGKYAKLSFELEEYSAKFDITLDFSTNTVYQKRFNRLLNYLQAINK